MEQFTQAPPALGNQYRDDRMLRGLLRRLLPDDVLGAIEPELEAMGELSGGRLYRMQLAEYAREPVLTRWDPWGKRIDHIEVTPLWQVAERIAAEYGLVAAAYQQRHGRFDRIQQFALVYLFSAASDVYSCPLAMTDGAACALTQSGNRGLIERAVSRLTSRDPQRFWTSGQWMTETPGGSDVGHSETTARRDAGGRWRLYGRKWFTSAITAQMALTLARPQGNPPGAKGLALYYVETQAADGDLNGIEVLRLKDKLGTRKVPTAELLLNGTVAELVGEPADGVRAITPMLNVTRTWNTITAVSFMRRGIALARDYARKRHAFGGPLADKPAHVDTLAGLQAEAEAALHLSFRVVELLGRRDSGDITEAQDHLLRIVTPIAKLLTGRQAVAVTSEVVEAFGGAGYIEDTGIPALLRDAQVLSIWEGTTNVLALDTLRAIRKVGGLDAVAAEIELCRRALVDGVLAHCLEQARSAFAHAAAWLRGNLNDAECLEGGARRFAMTIGRALALALLARHAQWALENGADVRPRAAARRFAAAGVDLIVEVSPREADVLANDRTSGGR